MHFSYKERLAHLRNDIKLLFLNKNYIECKKKTLDLLELMAGVDSDYNIWFCYFMLSQIASIQKDAANFERYAELAIKHSITESQMVCIKFNEALFYENIDVNRTLKKYDECIVFYLKNNMKIHLAVALKNKGVILSDIEMIKDAIEIYEKILPENEVQKIEKESWIDMAYQALIDIYIIHKNQIEAMKALRNIKNEVIQRSSAIKLSRTFSRDV